MINYNKNKTFDLKKSKMRIVTNKKEQLINNHNQGHRLAFSSSLGYFDIASLLINFFLFYFLYKS